MKKYLVFKDIVHHAGIGHTLMCYNNAANISTEKGQELIVPKCVMGHGLGNNFQFEIFFGLPQYDDQYIEKLINENLNDVEVIEWEPCNSRGGGCVQSYDFTRTILFFKDHFLKTMEEKSRIYKTHAVADKVNIAIHIRRGDIILDIKNFEKFKDNKLKITPDAWFKLQLDQILLTNQLSIQDVHINIYSEVDKDGLYYNEKREVFDLKTVFDMNNCTFYFNKDMWETLYNMIVSDIFLGATWGVPITVALYREILEKKTYLERHNAHMVDINHFKHVKIIG